MAPAGNDGRILANAKTASGETAKVHWPEEKLPLLTLGVVYGDIGTSPIYALREALHAATGGAPEEIRTPDPQIRSLVLYPAELRARNGPQIDTTAAVRSRDRPRMACYLAIDIRKSKPGLSKTSPCRHAFASAQWTARLRVRPAGASPGALRRA